MEMRIFVAICIASCTAFAVAREVPVEPSADFEKTFARVRKEMKAGEPIEFVFEDGIHVLRSCIVLKPSDTGLVFRARHPGKAVLVGGVSLKGSDFKPVSAANAPKGLPETTRGNAGILISNEEGIMLNGGRGSGTNDTVKRYSRGGL